MARRTQIEQERFKRIKMARSLIRLSHSLAADDEVNDKLQDIAEDFDKGAQKGVLPPDTRAALKKLLG